VVADLDVAAASDTAEAIRAAGGEALNLGLDVREEASWAQAVDATLDSFGALHILVNNAGLMLTRSIEETSLDDWRRLTAVNLDGVFLGTRLGMATIKRFVGPQTPSGAIVNLSSMAALVGSVLTGAYSATKAGVHLFSKCAALECARFGYNIRVNTVHPGVIATTSMGAQVFEDFGAAGRRGPEETRERLRRMHPIGRLGTAEDVARGILFLASADSGFMTGTELVVDGGFTAQ
jgi:NAD(P)-dependent dehydrogenase (short-subunit alcohol dehydrogenase family)